MSMSLMIMALPLAGEQAEFSRLPPPQLELPASEQRSDSTSTIEREGPDEAGLAPPTKPDDAIVVTGDPNRVAGDPLRALNAESFSVVQSVDEAVTGPVALAYRRVVPRPVRSGVRNFMSNLQEPVVFLNYLLQLKPGKSAETLGRFAINSTIGAAGLFDVAKRRPFQLPRRTNGFAYTLGYYGVEPGAYLYLPLIGPTTVRDLGGRLVDLSVLPVAVGRPFDDPLFAIPTTVVRLIDERAEADDEIRALRDGATDPYSTVRAEYLRKRQAEIDALRATHREKDQSSSEPAMPSEGVIAAPFTG